MLKSKKSDPMTKRVEHAYEIARAEIDLKAFGQMPENHRDAILNRSRDHISEQLSTAERIRNEAVRFSIFVGFSLTFIFAVLNLDFTPKDIRDFKILAVTSLLVTGLSGVAVLFCCTRILASDDFLRPNRPLCIALKSIITTESHQSYWIEDLTHLLRAEIQNEEYLKVMQTQLKWAVAFCWATGGSILLFALHVSPYKFGPL